MTKKEATVVCIKPIVKKTAKIRIIGDSPLIVHAWSEKAKKELLASQQGTKLKKDKKQAKNIYGEIAEALYWMNGKPDVTTPTGRKNCWTSTLLPSILDSLLVLLRLLPCPLRSVWDGRKTRFPLVVRS